MICKSSSFHYTTVMPHNLIRPTSNAVDLVPPMTPCSQGYNYGIVELIKYHIISVVRILL